MIKGKKEGKRKGRNESGGAKIETTFIFLLITLRKYPTEYLQEIKM